jgi:DNA repair protein SbcD/Mre11
VSRPSSRILHSSDLHLGAQHGRAGPAWHGPDCVCPLKTLTRAAELHSCDLLIITGDLFDRNQVPAALVRTAVAVLAAADIECVIVPGNHDCLDTHSVYRQDAFAAAGPRLHVVTAADGEHIDWPGPALRVWARGMIQHEPAFRPLAGAPPRDAARWCIVAGHGHYMEHEPGRTEQARSSPIYGAELARLDTDYVALGHWDMSQQVGNGNAAAWYSGAPVIGGSPRTALLVSFEPPNSVNVAACPLEPYVPEECLGDDRSVPAIHTSQREEQP